MDDALRRADWGEATLDPLYRENTRDRTAHRAQLWRALPRYARQCIHRCRTLAAYAAAADSQRIASMISSICRPKSPARSSGDSPALNLPKISIVGTRDPVMTGRPNATAGSIEMMRGAAATFAAFVCSLRDQVNGKSRTGTPLASRSI